MNNTEPNQSPTVGVIDYRSLLIRPKRRFFLAIAQWFAQASWRGTVAAVVTLCGLILWWSRTPAPEIGESIARNVSILLIAVAVFIRVVGWGAGGDARKVRGWLRMTFLALFVLTSAILVISDGALALAFAASKPAMNRLAAFAAANPSAPLPDQWVGLFYAEDIRRIGGGICFRVTGDRSDGSGFANGSLDSKSALLPGEIPRLVHDFHQPWKTWDTNW
jgi:hypothetical protein